MRRLSAKRYALLNPLCRKAKLEEEILVLEEIMQNLVAENACVAQDQEKYQKHYNGLVEQYETANSGYDERTYSIEQNKPTATKC